MAEFIWIKQKLLIWVNNLFSLYGIAGKSNMIGESCTKLRKHDEWKKSVMLK
jgi:hypothetical protein